MRGIEPIQSAAGNGRYLRKAAGCSQHSSSLGIAVRNVSLSRKIEGLVGKASIEPILRRSFMH